MPEELHYDDRVRLLGVHSYRAMTLAQAVNEAMSLPDGEKRMAVIVRDGEPMMELPDIAAVYAREDFPKGA